MTATQNIIRQLRKKLKRKYKQGEIDTMSIDRKKTLFEKFISLKAIYRCNTVSTKKAMTYFTDLE